MSNRTVRTSPIRASTGIALLAAVAVGGGLALDGGPWQARKDRRDDARRDDLQRLSSQVQCLADTNGGRLPQNITSTDVCPAQLRLNDPFTDAPYRYEVIDPANYRLCAVMEHPSPSDTLWGGSSWDNAKGCLIGRLSVPADAQPANRPEATPPTPEAPGP